VSEFVASTVISANGPFWRKVILGRLSSSLWNVFSVVGHKLSRLRRDASKGDDTARIKRCDGNVITPFSFSLVTILNLILEPGPSSDDRKSFSTSASTLDLKGGTTGAPGFGGNGSLGVEFNELTEIG